MAFMGSTFISSATLRKDVRVQESISIHLERLTEVWMTKKDMWGTLET